MSDDWKSKQKKFFVGGPRKHARHFPLRPLHFTDVAKAAEYLLREAADRGVHPQLEKNPNSKLSLIHRMLEELLRLRQQNAQLTSDIAAYFTLFNQRKDQPCPPAPAPAAATPPTPPPGDVPPADTASAPPA